MLQGDEYSTQVSFGHVGREDARRITFINANMEHLSCAKSQEHEHIDELNTMAEKTHASNKRRSTHARKTSIIMSCQNRIVLSRQYICTYTSEDLQISYDTPNFSQIAKYTPLSDRWPKSPCASSGPNACTARDHCEFSKYFNRKTKGISFFVCARPSKLKLALTIYYWLNFAFNI